MDFQSIVVYLANNFTKRATDWQLFLKLEALDFVNAIRLERKIKSMKSSKFIQNLEKYSELREKIIDETKQ